MFLPYFLVFVPLMWVFTNYIVDSEFTLAYWVIGSVIFLFNLPPIIWAKLVANPVNYFLYWLWLRKMRSIRLSENNILDSILKYGPRDNSDMNNHKFSHFDYWFKYKAKIYMPYMPWFNYEYTYDY